MLQFSANAQSSPLSERKQSKDNVFTAAEENHFEFIDETRRARSQGFLALLKRCFLKTTQ
ncbi:phage capsid scaffolding (GPO) serine peptidase family protein [Proteus mirabilis]|nr:phage capsid scaffolding (GPO) serine peptidase family protein [Proteus mirabilis]